MHIHLSSRSMHPRLTCKTLLQSWQRSTAPGAAHRANLKAVMIPEAPFVFADFLMGTLVGKFHQRLCYVPELWIISLGVMIFFTTCSISQAIVLKDLNLCQIRRRLSGMLKKTGALKHWTAWAIWAPKASKVSSILGCRKRMRSVHCVCSLHQYVICLTKYTIFDWTVASAHLRPWDCRDQKCMFWLDLLLTDQLIDTLFCEEWHRMTHFFAQQTCLDNLFGHLIRMLNVRIPVTGVPAAALPTA